MAEEAIVQASMARAELICFPESFVPGYRGMGKAVSPPNPAFLARAWSTIAVVRPNGTLLSYRPYGQEGLLIADLDISPPPQVC